MPNTLHPTPYSLYPTIDCSSNPFNLDITLSSGQAFRWRKDRHGVWWGVINDLVAALWQKEGEPDSPVYWQTFPKPDQIQAIRDYFRLDVDLDSLYGEWIRAEPRIEPAVTAFRGLRILQQPPVECFFSFQCACCNTITKIERTVWKLAERYGEPIYTGNEFAPQEPFYTFPTLEALMNADESLLRSDLWGYRAPRVINLARHIHDHPGDWLMELRAAPYPEVKASLMALHGVGPKLADCIALFSLDKDYATPIDTHVRQIACRLFLPELEGKSLTPRIYDLLAAAYQERFGQYAGWAQQYLFFAELDRSLPKSL